MAHAVSPAPDVLVLLEAGARLPFFQVGQILQKFECRDQSRGGITRNVVQGSIPTLLEEQEGATLLISVKFDLVSIRNIYLQFEEISFQNIKISEELQALIAPAMLPRSFISLQIVLSKLKFQLQIQVEQDDDRLEACITFLIWTPTCFWDARLVVKEFFVFTRAQPFIC